MAFWNASPLQRLGDQRRRLALAGLAAGALVAAALKRRKGQDATEFGKAVPIPQAPKPVAASTPVESGPPAEVEVPPATAEPDVPEGPPPAAPDAPAVAPAAAAPDVPEVTPGPGPDAVLPMELSAETHAELPINAPADEPAPAESRAAEEASAPTVEPATGELSAEEASILAVLAQSGRLDDDRTALAVATSLERETTDVAGVLRKLSAEGVVSGELYTAAGDKIWAVTERGVRRLGAQS